MSASRAGFPEDYPLPAQASSSAVLGVVPVACGEAVVVAVVRHAAACSLVPLPAGPRESPPPAQPSPAYAHFGLTRDSVQLGVAFPSRDDYRFVVGVDGPRGGRRACPVVYASGTSRKSLEGVPLIAADREAMQMVALFAQDGGNASGTIVLRGYC